jgi:Mg2+ and Co2+ transporter CorA
MLRGGTGGMSIDFENGTDITKLRGPTYQKTGVELQAEVDYIDSMLQKGHIHKSQSPIGAPCIFVKKKDRKLRSCIDLRKVNDAMIKNAAPMPLLNDLMDQVQDSKVFTKLDLKNRYHLFRIKEGDEWKTVFNMHKRHYKMLVVPFGLTNALAFFQTQMNEILWDLREQGVICYIDDILIHTKDGVDYMALVKEVLEHLRKNFLYANGKKCVFME